MDDLEGFQVLYGKSFSTPVTFACSTMSRFGANLEGCEIDENWRKAQNIYFENPGPFTVYTDDSETFTLPRLIGAQTSPVEYYSWDPDVAYFIEDDSTNTLHIAGPGTVTISASVPEDDDYMEGSASFELTVVEGSSANQYGNEYGYIGYEFDFDTQLEGWPQDTNPDGKSFTSSSGSFDAYGDARESNALKLYLSPGVYQTEVSEEYGLHIPKGGYIGLPAIPGYSLNYVDIQVYGEDGVQFTLSSTAPNITPIVSVDSMDYYSDDYPGSFYFLGYFGCNVDESAYLFFDEECNVVYFWMEYIPVYEDGAPDISGGHVHNDNDAWL